MKSFHSKHIITNPKSERGVEGAHDEWKPLSTIKQRAGSKVTARKLRLAGRVTHYTKQIWPKKDRIQQQSQKHTRTEHKRNINEEIKESVAMNGERAPLIHFVTEVIITFALYLSFAALHLPVAVLSHALMVFYGRALHLSSSYHFWKKPRVPVGRTRILHITVWTRGLLAVLILSDDYDDSIWSHNYKIILFASLSPQLCKWSIDFP